MPYLFREDELIRKDIIPMENNGDLWYTAGGQT
jgi:hypothetical protein